MKDSDLELRLQAHAQRVKTHMIPPDIQRKDLIMMKPTKKRVARLALIAAVICVFGTTALAAYHFLSPKEIANSMGDDKLAGYLAEGEHAPESKTDGNYTATLLEVTSGKELSQFASSAWELFPDRTYAVVAIERTDGSAITHDDNLLVSPLIEGLNPIQYNIFTMNGGYTEKIIDNVLYRIVEFDSITYFADHHLYLTVLSETFYDANAYRYDEETGLITVNEEFDGTNILFDIALDPALANPSKAADYLQTLALQNTRDADTSDAEEVVITAQP